MQKHILIIEDDENVADGLTDIFKGCDYRVYAAANSRDAWQLLRSEQIHLIILDVSLGSESGYDVCRQIRLETQVPVLFLTARSSEMELIRGFQAGGDDYVTKPFRVQELIVRVQALLRRAEQGNDRLITSGDLTYNRKLQRLYKSGNALELTVTEWKLCSALLEHAPMTLTREKLLYLVWDKEASFVEANTLNVNISRLREKLGNYNETPYIETVRGIGYRWAVPAGG